MATEIERATARATADEARVPATDGVRVEEDGQENRQDDRARALKPPHDSSALADRPTLPWRSLFSTALRWWLATRLGLALVLLAAGTLWSGNDTPVGAVSPDAHALVTPTALLARLDVWDASIFYLPIALKGYTRQAQLAFWPLYPSLIRVGLVLTGRWGAWDRTHALIVALVVSNLATLFAFLAVAALVYQETRRRAWAERAVQALALSPFAFWLALPYSDSLYLALATFALLALRRRQWWLVALFSFWAALSRPTSAALALVVGAVLLVALYRWLRAGAPERWADWRQPLRRLWSLRASALIPPTLALLAGPAGAAVWLGACAYAFPQWGGWRAPLDATAKVFGYTFSVGGGWVSLQEVWRDLAAPPHLSYATTRLLLDALPVLVSLTLVIIAWTGIGRRRQNGDRKGQPPVGRRGRRGRIAWPLALYTTLVTALTLWSPLLHQLFQDPIVAAGRLALAASPLTLVWIALTSHTSAQMRWMRWWRLRWPARGLRTLETTVAPLLQALLFLFLLLGGWLV